MEIRFFCLPAYKANPRLDGRRLRTPGIRILSRYKSGPLSGRRNRRSPNALWLPLPTELCPDYVGLHFFCGSHYLWVSIKISSLGAEGLRITWYCTIFGLRPIESDKDRYANSKEHLV
ncbi:hypothetical protein EVAR_47392_1 [Eumeta japonica]|uniref:Uncharacterized protein n=1 Tax=Eumeta variegata TaxID=151549 RepID=A0A4C1WUG9_EUMVA|nr:hypothetical protein EVAR_47392_1 [Eumeta japonica]